MTLSVDIYAHWQSITFGGSLVILTFAIFGLLGHPAGHYRLLRLFVLTIFAAGVITAFVFLFEYSTVGYAIGTLVITSGVLIVLNGWYRQLLNGNPDSTRLYIYVAGVIGGIVGVYSSLASIAP